MSPLDGGTARNERNILRGHVDDFPLRRDESSFNGFANVAPLPPVDSSKGWRGSGVMVITT